MRLKILVLLFVTTIQAQLIVTPNPFGINSGTITVTYGSAGNYSLFDPLSDPNLLLYTGLETDGVVSTWDYHDDFNNTSTMTPLTFNASLGHYVATLNIGTRTYQQEPTLATTTIPSTVFVNNWYFLIRNISGSRQSADLQGSNYGFVSSTLSLKTNEFLNQEIYISKNKIYNNLLGKTNIEIYNQLGQKLTNFELNQNETKELNINSTGVFIAIISNKNRNGNIKFVN